MANQSSIVMSTSFYIFGEIMNLIESQNPSTCKKQKKNPKWKSPCAASDVIEMHSKQYH
jgi:hypothetical protein